MALQVNSGEQSHGRAPAYCRCDEKRRCPFVVNTTEGEKSLADSKSIRRSALMDKIPYYTTLAGAEAAVAAIAALGKGDLQVCSLQEYESKRRRLTKHACLNP
jgi:hypothetical protein